MSTNAEFGRLKPVPIKECWEKEATDFTPWLAREENIAVLGEAIGLELEVQQEEVSVGPFRADMLCRDTSSDELVVIENQIVRTDHSHLGQILTYAAGLDAVTLIWIAASFTEEHRAALDWLNRITGESFHFFGIEVEVWRIGDSPPAPKFNVVAKPNDWAKTVKESATRGGALTAGQAAQMQYWSEFGAFLRDHDARFRSPKPGPSNWMAWGLGRGGVTLIAVANAKEVMAGLDVHIDRHPGWFQQLYDARQSIEKELGFQQDWDAESNNKYRRIRVRKRSDISSQQQRLEAFSWTLEKMDRIDRVFRPYVKKLEDDLPLE